jgi:site-specific recombinase XerD
MKQPIAIFDQAEFLETTQLHGDFLNIESFDIERDYAVCIDFLLSYRGSPDTFKSYRREIERLCQWAWLVAHKSIITLSRNDILNYIEFSTNPPLDWISIKSSHRFILIDSQRVANPEWRPFLVRKSKVDYLNSAIKLSPKQYKMSSATVRSLFAGLGTFYTFLLQEQLIQYHPVHSIRQKNQFLLKKQSTRVSRTLSKQQWQVVIETTIKKSITDSTFHRHVFILSACYLLGLRISELVPTYRHTPTMGDFYKDHNQLWWFLTIGKGNKEREIAVPNSMLNALTNYRKFLKLSTKLPTKGEKTPILPKTKGYGSIGERQVRNLIQACFDMAIEALKIKNQHELADDLSAATAHWLRHTAISHDVENRPREHVRDDAGHHNISVTDLYIDTTRNKRHESAINKKLIPTDD